VALVGSGQRSARLDEAPATHDGRSTTAWAADATVLQASPAVPTANPVSTTGPSVPTADELRISALVAEGLDGDPPLIADAADRRAAQLIARPGAPVRLRLPTIQVDTDVKSGGPVIGKNGEREWETLPFVATTYPILGPVGGIGNPVISGHVVTLREGNVFRDLYKLELGDLIDVDTQDSRFAYRVEEIKLVDPSDVAVMAPTDDARLTLITCGGTFDSRSRTFSDRLIIIGRLLGGERLNQPV
jgi:sortase A